MTPRTSACASRFASPLEGEADREAVGRGVSSKYGASGLPPSLALPLKGGGDILCSRWSKTDG